MSIAKTEIPEVIKKQWARPEMILIGENTIQSKTFAGHHEHAYISSSAQPGGGFLAFKAFASTGVALGHRMASYLS
jgi:hypothetical protein